MLRPLVAGPEQLIESIAAWADAQPDVQAAFLVRPRRSAGCDPLPRMRARSLVVAAAVGAALALAAAPAVGGVDAPTVTNVVVAAAGPSAAAVTWFAGPVARTRVQGGVAAGEGRLVPVLYW